MDIDWLLKKEVARGVSDLYLFPVAVGYQLLTRNPAGIHTISAEISTAQGQMWLNLLKYRAGMNLSEHRRVQQGAMFHKETKCFLRLSTVGDFQDRESLVVRIINAVPPITAASAPYIELLQRLAEQRGLLTVCGPTGAGKTTLLYQLARELATQRVVMTIEDPVEINEPRFLQLQVNHAAGMTYASLLKASLRHRPDVVIIGELRDEETARAACEAALAGHIVLATVHTGSAADVPLRLASLGVPSVLINAALRGTAQVQLHTGAAGVAPLVEIWQWQQGKGQRLTGSLRQQEVLADAAATEIDAKGTGTVM